MLKIVLVAFCGFLVCEASFIAASNRDSLEAASSNKVYESSYITNDMLLQQPYTAITETELNNIIQTGRANHKIHGYGLFDMVGQSISVVVSLTKFVFGFIFGNQPEAAINLSNDSTVLTDTLHIQTNVLKNFLDRTLSRIPIIGLASNLIVAGVSVVMFVPKILLKIIKSIASASAYKHIQAYRYNTLG